MGRLLPVNRLRLLPRRLAYAVGNDDGCLAYLGHLRRSVSLNVSKTVDLLSSNRCCPEGNRESVVTMLLVIDV